MLLQVPSFSGAKHWTPHGQYDAPEHMGARTPQSALVQQKFFPGICLHTPMDVAVAEQEPPTHS
jgi:hypothetical protein